MLTFLSLAGIWFIISRAWKPSQSGRERLRYNRLARLTKRTTTRFRLARSCLKKSVAHLSTVLVARPRQASAAIAIALKNKLGPSFQGNRSRTFKVLGLPGLLGALFICSLPFLVFVSVGLTPESIFNVIMTGLLVGLLFTPLAWWYYGPHGPTKAIRLTLFTVVGVAWGSVMLVATLLAMTVN